MSTGRYGHMVHEYYVGRVRSKMAERRARLDALSSPGDAEAYVEHVRQAVRRCFGPEPERTPLSPVVCGSREFEGFSIERVTLESRPGFLVTGNLYLPESAVSNTPAVLGLCGHSAAGKAEEKYQAFCQGLARKGFVVFIIDPISQGERTQFYESDGPALPSLCGGHNVIGNQLSLFGDFFGSWRAWDAIRALDYLLSRPEVDPSRVGVTGNSGGGTLTAFVTALDPRITMAAPSCYICSLLANLQNELPADSEQNPPGMLRQGLDHADLLMCYAPRPTMVLSQVDDYFDERYARSAYEDVRRVHRLLGHEDEIEYFAGPHGHGYHRENREAMYGFFMKHARIRGSAEEPELTSIGESDLYATPNGDTAQAGSRRVFDFIKDRVQPTTADGAFSGRNGPKEEELIATSLRLLDVPHASEPPSYRILSRYAGTRSDLNQRGVFAVETEPGVQALVTAYGLPMPTMRPPVGAIAAFVGHTGAERDLSEVAELRALTASDQPLVGIDPRGFGETVAMTSNSDDFFDAYGSDFMYASFSDMLGESYLGRRVFDVLRCLDFLYGGGASEIELIGRGLGSVIAAFAGLIHSSRPRVRLFGYLPGFRLLAEDPLACWPLSSLARGVLDNFDLPDVYRALSGRIVMHDPWDARMAPAGSESA